NHTRTTETAAGIQEAFTERPNRIENKRQAAIENLSMQVAALSIFDSSQQYAITARVTKIDEENSRDTEFNHRKTDAIQQASDLNEQKKHQKAKAKVKNVEALPLLKLRKQALEKKQHPYELLKANGYIKKPLKEFY